ncbi:MAG: type II secretion system secretin GspD [Sulfurihydrogenibium sp.]|uniref:type II secretion system secretin GspD n=1 Tax=Sulfurihydrogenibium sp. TaxID=2053621 RepID=UPI003C7DE93A
MKRKILAILLTIVMLSQSFAEEKQQNTKQTQTDQTTTLEDAKKYKKEGKVLLNFRNADISDVVTFMATLTGKNIVLSEDVKGNITLTSGKPVSLKEAWDLFTIVLAMNNLSVVEDKNIVRVVPVNKAIPTLSKATSSGALEFFIYPLENANVNDVLNAVRPFLSPTAKASAHIQSNTIIIYDYKANVDAVKNLLEILDSKEKSGTLYVYPLKYLKAEEVYKTISPMIAAMQKNNQIAVAPNPESNSIVIYANESNYKTLKDILDSLDTQRVLSEGRSFYIIPLKYTTVSEISKSLQSLFSNISPVVPEPTLQQQPQQPPNQPIFMENRTQQPFPNQSPTTLNPTFPNTTLPTQTGFPATTTTTTSVQQTAIPTITTKEGIKIGFDIGTNSIILYATEKEYLGLKKFIENLDIRRKQVLLTTTIVEASTKKLLDIGVRWQAVGTLGGAAFRGATKDSIYQSFVSGNFLLGFLSSSGKTVSVGGTSVVFPDLALLFSLLESGSGFNIISNPKVLTLDNQPAEIKVGNVIPFASGVRFDINGQPIVTYDYREVGLDLKVVPRVSSSDNLRLTINLVLQEVTDFINPSVGGLSYTVPVTSNRALNSDVVVENGQLIVIGGLVNNKTIKSMEGIPVLKDLPVIGNLFKHESKTDEKTTLFIFITPYIISSPEELTKITEEHKKLSEEIQKALEKKENK